MSEADVIAEYAARAPARPPASLGEVWSAEWASAGLSTLSGIGAPLQDAYEDLRKGVEGAAGRPVEDIAAERGIPLQRARSLDERAAMLSPIIAALPEDARKTIDPLRDIRGRAADKAQAIERNAAETATATYGLSGWAVAHAAGIARQAVDPINLGLTVATAPLGGEGGAIVPYLARQAAIGAGVQAVQEPFIQASRGELGLESGVRQAAGDIVGAGVGAAGISGLFRAGAAALRMSFPKPAPVAPPEPFRSDVGMGGYTGDLSFTDRGEPIDFRHVGALGDIEGGGYGIGDFTVPDNLGPTREKLPPPAPIGPSDTRLSPIGPEDVAALDRGAPIDYREVAPLGDVETGYHGNFDFAPMDFEAAANLAERDDIIGGMAPDQSGPGRQAHDVLLGDADTIINQGHEFRPLFDIAAIERISQSASARQRAAELDAVLRDLPKGDAAAAETLARLHEIDRQIADPEISKADRKRLVDRRDELLADTNPETLQAAAAPIEQRRLLAAERAKLAIRIAEIDKETANARLEFAIAHKPAERGPAVATSGMRAPEGATMPVGDQQLAADAERAMAAHGDMVMELENPDGSIRRVTAREELAAAEEDAAAARELVDCLGGIAEDAV